MKHISLLTTFALVLSASFAHAHVSRVSHSHPHTDWSLILAALLGLTMLSALAFVLRCNALKTGSIHHDSR